MYSWQSINSDFIHIRFFDFISNNMYKTYQFQIEFYFLSIFRTRSVDLCYVYRLWQICYPLWNQQRKWVVLFRWINSVIIIIKILKILFVKVIFFSAELIGWNK